MKLLAALLLFTLACATPPAERVRVELAHKPASLDRLMLRLLADAPPARPLGVTLLVSDEPCDGMLGYTMHLGGENWLIQIDEDMPYQLQRVVLTHEWAHVLQGDGGCGLEGSHGPTFGVAWAAAWRAAVGEKH